MIEEAELEITAELGRRRRSSCIESRAGCGDPSFEGGLGETGFGDVDD